jgi:hypothetical protein
MNLTRIIRSPQIYFLLFSFWAMLILGAFYQKAFGPELRYSRVAEGNISKIVSAMWSKGFSGFKDVISDDAHIWGRIRPGHWLYYNIPFAVVLLRNGDMFRTVPQVQMSHRINGDLQTHIIFLLVSRAVACGGICWLLWRYSSTLWAPLLFPIYVASFYALSENFVVYHCDSQEIPQLLFIVLYIISISKFFEGKVPKKWLELLSIFFCWLHSQRMMMF